MRLTKLAHAGVRLVKDGATPVIDPGGFGSGTEALAEADAVLITHEHADHVDADALRAALDDQPGLRVWSNPAVADQLGSFRGRVNRVRHGDAFTAAGFEVHVYGAEHALSHPEIPVVPNTGFLVEGEVFHPGDALTVPAEPVPTLLVPVCAVAEVRRVRRLFPPGESAPRVRHTRCHAQRVRAHGLGGLPRPRRRRHGGGTGPS